MLKNILTLMKGTSISQAIPILISPVLTRIYSPEDFGTFALYIGLANILSVLSTARYEMAIVLPKEDKEAINIFALSLTITFFVTFLTAVFAVFFKVEILHLLNAQNLGFFIYLLPISVLTAGLYQSFNYWANRKKYFKTISSSQISQSITISFFQTLLGYLQISGGLIFSNITGRIVSLSVLVRGFYKTDFLQTKDIRYPTMIYQMKKYRDFPFVNLLHAFSDIFKSSFSVILISSFFYSQTLGFYALALRVLQVPVGIVGSALGQVLYQRFSYMKSHDKKIYPKLLKVMVLSGLLSLPLFISLYFILPKLFIFVFGENWQTAGQYAQIMTPYLFFNFILSPVSGVPIIFEKQKKFFLLSLLGNIAMPLIIFLSYKSGCDLKEALYFISLFFCFLYAFMIFWILQISKGKNI